MSRDICAFQDFESASTPWSTGNPGECTRSGTNAINGSFSMRGVVDQTSAFNPSPFAKVGHGSRKGMLVIARFQFKAVALPSGYTPAILEIRGSGSDGGAADTFGVYRESTNNKWRLFVADVGGIAAATADSSSNLNTATVYDVRLEGRQERANGMRLQLWVGGTLEATLVAATKQILDVQACVVGGSSGGKGSGTEYIWDDFLINVAQDPS